MSTNFNNQQRLQTTQQQRLQTKQFANAKMSRLELHSIHETLLEQGKYFDSSAPELVNIIGGIDRILTDYFIHKDLTLKPQQIELIHQIMITPERNRSPKAKSNSIINTTSSNNILEDTDHMELVFDETNTYLTSICGIQNATKLLLIIHHKLFRFFLVLSFIAWLGIINIFSNIVHPIYEITMSCIKGFVWAPYITIFALSVNKNAMKQTLKSFEFWLKLIYSMIYFIVLFIDQYYIKWDEWEDPYMFMIGDLINQYFFVMSVVVMGAYDGFKNGRKWKIGLAGFFALFYGFVSIYYQFLIVYDTESKHWQLSASMISIAVSCARVIAIFLFKQAVLTAVSPKKPLSLGIIRIYNGRTRKMEEKISKQWLIKKWIEMMMKVMKTNGICVPL
eukprot:611573_1